MVNNPKIAEVKTMLDEKFPDGFTHVTSVKHEMHDSRDGVVSQVTNQAAAEHLVKGTARLSSKAELPVPAEEDKK